MSELPKKLEDEVNAFLSRKGITGTKKDSAMRAVRKLYRQSMYDPEEPVGVVTAQSLSEPATQMSLDYTEKVILKHNGRIIILPIGEFVDETMKRLGKRVVNGWEVCNISGYSLFAMSLNSNEKIEEGMISEISRHEAPEKILEIKTRSGRMIRATDSHSFVIRKNNKIVPVSGKELKTGDRLPAISFLPENCEHEMKTESIIGRQSYVKKPLPEKLELNNALGWLFGAYLSEGNATNFYVSFSNTDPLFLSKVRNFALTYGFTFNEYDNLRGFKPSHDIRINSKQLSLLMKKTCKTGSSSKQVPDFAYSADIDFVSGLLRGYFDGGGNVSVNRRVIRISSSSRNLIDGIALLLTRFGIFARKSRTKEFSLTIPYRYAQTFRDKIGFTVTSKAKRLDELCSLFERNKNNYQDFVDMIGGFDDILLTISKKLQEPSRYVNSFTKRQKIGRNVLLKYIKSFEEKAINKNIDISKELAILKRMHDSDVVWDEVVDISYVKPTCKYVYDFTVPGTETFTTFDGIVTHNTMRTYHFAGTAGIQVTLGLPRMLEIFDARKEPKTPTMTVYVNKDIKEVSDVKRIAENIKEVKLKDIVLSTTLDLTELWIKCRLNLPKMQDLGIDLQKLPKMIKIRSMEITVEGDIIMARSKKEDLRNLHKMKYSLLETHIKGIKGISQVIVSKDENGEWVISTLGSNLKKVFEIEGVDPSRTITNNIFEIYDVLGIEAARNAIIQQAQFTMEEQGLGVDVRYIMLLADLMTVEGTIRAIGRYGISGQKASVLVRASFEETKKHLTTAAIEGEYDDLQGTVENIMMNQVAPIGTGAFELVGRIPEIGKPKKTTVKKAAAGKTAKKTTVKKKSK